MGKITFTNFKEFVESYTGVTFSSIEEFDRVFEWAYDELNSCTFGRLDELDFDLLASNYPCVLEKIKKAIALMMISLKDSYINSLQTTRNKSSESLGNYSVSYTTDSAVANGVQSKIRTILNGTNLMNVNACNTIESIMRDWKC